MNENKNLKKEILSSSVLFGFVQVINILSRAAISKVIAYSYGVSGIAFLGMINSLYDLFKSFFLFGLNESSVTKLSNIDLENKEEKKILGKYQLFIFLIALFSLLVINITCVQLSNFTETDVDSIRIISFAIYFFILSEGKFVILRSLRFQKELALSRIISMLLSFLVSIPLILLYGDTGIVYSFLVISLFSYLLSFFYTFKLTGFINFSLINFFTNIFEENKVIFVLGLSMMVLNFVGTLSDFLIKLYLNKSNNIESLGLFQAGNTLVSGYLGIAMTSIVMDFFPRISKISDNNSEVNRELNAQIDISIYLIVPLILLLLNFIDEITVILYSEKFYNLREFFFIAITGSFINVISNTMGYILIAKNETKVFLQAALIVKTLYVISSVSIFSMLGFVGLGMGFLISSIFNFLYIYNKIRKLYNLFLTKKTKISITIGLLIVSILSLTLYLSTNHFSQYLTLFVSILTFFIYIKILLIKTGIMK